MLVSQIAKAIDKNISIAGSYIQLNMTDTVS